MVRPLTDYESGPWDEHAHILMRLAPGISQVQREALNRLDPPLGITQYGILARLAHGPRSMSDIRLHSMVTFPTLSGAISALARHGLLERERNEHDRRSVDLSLTTHGEHVLGHAQRVLGDIRMRLTDGLPASAAELEEFWRPLVWRVRALLAEQSDRDLTAPAELVAADNRGLAGDPQQHAALVPQVGPPVGDAVIGAVDADVDEIPLARCWLQHAHRVVQARSPDAFAHGEADASGDEVPHQAQGS